MKRRCFIMRTGLVALVLLLASRTSAQLYPERIPGPAMRLNPSVAFDNSTFLVVWEDWRKSEESDILGARVDQNQELIDTNAIRICSAARNQSAPAIADSGNTYLVVWEDFRSGAPAIFGARVRSGLVLDPEGIRISSSGAAAQHPAVSPFGGGFFVVWQEALPDSEFRIAGARVGASGSVVDTSPLRISHESGWQARPRVAYDSNSRRAGVVWESHSVENDSISVCGTRVSSSGIILDSPAVCLCTCASRQTEPSLAFSSDNSGPGFFVVWQDDRQDSSAIYGTWLDSLLIPRNPAGIPIDSSPHSQMHPCAAGHTLRYQWNCVVHWQERRHGRFWEILDAGVWRDRIEPWGQWIPLSDSFDLTAPAYAFAWPGGIHSMDVGLTVMTGDSAGMPAVYHSWAVVLGTREQTGHRKCQSISLWPVPASRSCTIRWTATGTASSTVQVFDIIGRLRKRVSLGTSLPEAQQLTLNVTDLSPGVYVVQLESGEARVRGRLVVQR